MRKCRGASSKAALSFFGRVRQRSAYFVERHWASPLEVESFSEPIAMAPASMEYVPSLASALKHLESEEDARNWKVDARQLVASASEKSLWTKYPRIAVKRDQADRRFHEPAIGSGRSRVVSHLAPPISWEGEQATGCEPFLFLVGRVLPLVLQQLIRNSQVCH
jgi:hypothetical protein